MSHYESHCLSHSFSLSILSFTHIHYFCRFALVSRFGPLGLCWHPSFYLFLFNVFSKVFLFSAVRLRYFNLNLKSYSGGQVGVALVFKFWGHFWIQSLDARVPFPLATRVSFEILIWIILATLAIRQTMMQQGLSE